MATYTEHYNLIKPALNDKVNINNLNDNADIIDTALYNKVDTTETQNITTSANNCMLSDGTTSVEDAVDELKSGLTNMPLYVIVTDDIVLGSGASGNVMFSKSSFTIPSGYTANWGACIYSVVGGWGIGCNSQAAFDSGVPYFTDSNNLVVSVTSGSSAGNVTFRVTVAVQITANQ